MDLEGLFYWPELLCLGYLFSDLATILLRLHFHIFIYLYIALSYES